MKKLFLPLLTALSAFSLSASDSDLDRLIRSLESRDSFAADVDYCVTLPMAPDDVTYKVTIAAVAAPSDSLSPCDYRIEWSLDADEVRASGFAAYGSGNFFNFRNQRLAEYHADIDPAPFTGKTAVQRSAQFADLTPWAIALQLRAMLADSTYCVAVSHPSSHILVEARQSYKDQTIRELSYLFDDASGLPLKLNFENNPGAVSEQTVTATYAYPDGIEIFDFGSEQELIKRYPDVFDTYRQSTIRVENLAGTYLPAFSLPVFDSGRYTRQSRADRLPSAAVLVFLNPNVSSTAETVADVRRAVKSLPVNLDIFWIFDSNDSDTVGSILGKQTFGETALMSGRSLMRDLAVTETPTFIFVGADGIIRSTLIGHSDNLLQTVQTVIPDL